MDSSEKPTTTTDRSSPGRNARDSRRPTKHYKVTEHDEHHLGYRGNNGSGDVPDARTLYQNSWSNNKICEQT
jgi:hypothetical protein